MSCKICQTDLGHRGCVNIMLTRILKWESNLSILILQQYEKDIVKNCGRDLMVLCFAFTVRVITHVIFMFAWYYSKMEY